MGAMLVGFFGRKWQYMGGHKRSRAWIAHVPQQGWCGTHKLVQWRHHQLCTAFYLGRGLDELLKYQLLPSTVQCTSQVDLSACTRPASSSVEPRPRSQRTDSWRSRPRDTFIRVWVAFAAALLLDFALPEARALCRGAVYDVPYFEAMHFRMQYLSTSM